MLCKSVQVERPRASTSGGQSGRWARGGKREEDVAVVGEGFWDEEEVLLEDCDEDWDWDWDWDLARAIQEATEVQERHLGG